MVSRLFLLRRYARRLFLLCLIVVVALCLLVSIHIEEVSERCLFFVSQTPLEIATLRQIVPSGASYILLLSSLVFALFVSAIKYNKNEGQLAAQSYTRNLYSLFDFLMLLGG